RLPRTRRRVVPCDLLPPADDLLPQHALVSLSIAPRARFALISARVGGRVYRRACRDTARRVGQAFRVRLSVVLPGRRCWAILARAGAAPLGVRRAAHRRPRGVREWAPGARRSPHGVALPVPLDVPSSRRLACARLPRRNDARRRAQWSESVHV